MLAVPLRGLRALPGLTPPSSGPPPAFALVGAAGAIASNTGGTTTVAPAWGSGANRTLGDLLICPVAFTANNPTSPTTPSGWNATTLFGESNLGAGCIIYWKIAVGADAAPTIGPGTGGGFVSCMLLEFSGNAASPLDQQASHNTTSTASCTTTNAGADVKAGDLIIASSVGFQGTTAPTGATHAFNNGATSTVYFAHPTSTFGVSFAWGITTGNAAADSDTVTYTGGTGSSFGADLVIASFHQ